MKKFLTNLYLYRFFDNFMPIFPLYAVMFQDSGLSAYHISILFMVWSATSFFLNVPTGVLADTYSRKNLLIAGQIVKIVGYSFWLFYPNFWGFLLGFVFWGIKSALYSGTLESLIYDELKKFKKESAYTRIYGWANGMSQVGVIAASLLAIFITPFGYSVVIAVSIFWILVSFIPLLMIPYAPKVNSTQESEFFHLLKEGLSVSLRNKAILKLIIFISLAIGIDAVLDEFYNPFIRESGLSTQLLGLFFAITISVDAIASFIGYRFKHWENKMFYWLFAGCGIILLVAAINTGWITLAAMLIFTGVFRVIKLVFDGKLQDEIPSHIRATISSVRNFGTEISALVMFYLFGLIATDDNLHQGFLYMAIFMIILGVLYWTQRLGRNMRRSLTKEPKI